MNVLLRCGLRHHRRHPLQTVLTLLGIAAGIALLVAMQSAQRTAERAFDHAIATIAGDATHTIIAGSSGLPVDVYARLCTELGTRAVAPSVQVVARATGRPERTVLRVLGIDPLADVALRPWAAVGPRQREPFPVAELMTRPGAFVATRELLARLDVRRGDELALSVGGRPVAAHCAGALDVEGAAAQGLADVIVADVATAQEWTGRLDRVDRIDLRLVSGELDVDAALAAVAKHLPAGARVQPAGARQEGLASLARGFRVNLTALSLLSLLVGAFLVHETMRLSVIARRGQLGVLRALGVRGSALGRAVAAEGAVLGIAGGAAGACLGALAANVLLAPLVRTLNDHYATFSLQRVDVEPWLLAAAAGLGGAVSLVAALGPAIAASRVTARDVLVPARAAASSAPRSWARSLRRIVPAAGLAAVLLLSAGQQLVQAYAGVLALGAAVVAAVPPALSALLAAGARATARSGPFVRYVVRSTAVARDHLALPVAAMVLALATTLALATLVGSFRDSVAGWLGQVLPGDVYVSVPGGVDERTEPMLPAIAAAVRNTPGVAAAAVYHRTTLSVSDGSSHEGDVDVVGVEPTPNLQRVFPLIDGDDERGRSALAGGDGVWVSEPFAFRWHLGVGRELTIRTDRGDAVVTVAAVYRDYSHERGEIMVGASWLAQRADVGTTALGLEVAPGTAVAAVVAAARERAAAAGEQAVRVVAQRDLRESSLQVFDRTFAITNVMRLLCLLVACIGIYAAFAALQLERGAEIGLLRALGARPSRIGVVVLGQTALLGLCAGVLALPAGALLGHVLAHVINRVSFGWTLAGVAVPVRAIVELLLLAVGAALLAGLQPAWRFARMRPADALREA